MDPEPTDRMTRQSHSVASPRGKRSKRAPLIFDPVGEDSRPQLSHDPIKAERRKHSSANRPSVSRTTPKPEHPDPLSTYLWDDAERRKLLQLVQRYGPGKWHVKVAQLDTGCVRIRVQP